jgi:putative colanic acid biosynthesis glycosyltransferase
MRATQLNPKISIITVVKNDACGLQATLDSLFTQSVCEWECLIISGKSRDKTQITADLNAFRDARITHLEEEKSGIYQAMSQGVCCAKADYVIFMNAGDVFAFNGAVELILGKIINENRPVVIGGYAADGKSYSFKPRDFGPRDFSINRRWGCHQSMIFDKRLLLESGGFSLEYCLASDFDLVLRMIRNTKGLRIAEVISVIDSTGVSNANIRQVLKEKQEIRARFFGKGSVQKFEGAIWTLFVISKINSRKLLSKLR